MIITPGFLVLSSLFILSSSTSAASSPFSWLRGASERHNVIQWDNCSIFGIDSNDTNLLCGYYEVPMDYHDPKAGKARLAIAKYAATAPKIGTLFSNPGGPGASGLDLIVQFGLEISEILQGAYDIISWDPRGVGQFTFPGAVTCFNSVAEEQAFFQNTIVQSINYTIADKFDKQDQDELFSRTDQDSQLLIEFGKRCQQGPVGNHLQYVGTSSTVRDLVTLADCIVGQDKPIDYWGFSYGTVIGAGFLNMFPERAGHIILDAVIDPKIWVSNKTLRTLLTDAEKTYAAFAAACAASGKAGCKLVELVGDGATGPDIVKLLDDAHDTTLRLLRAGFDNIPSSPGDMRVALHTALALPATWSEFANFEAYPLLVLIFQTAQALHIPYGGSYHIPTEITPGGPEDSPPQTPISHAFDAILGADGFSDVENHIVMKDVLDEIVDVTQTVSQTFGATWSFGHSFGWPVLSVERLPPYDLSKLKNPVLLIGNTADPITPFVGAQGAAELIGTRATLVEQLGVGHTSFAEVSTCTLTIVATYLLTSKLPDVPSGQHIQCEIDPTNILFPPLNTTTPSKRDSKLFMRGRL